MVRAGNKSFDKIGLRALYSLPDRRARVEGEEYAAALPIESRGWWKPGTASGAERASERRPEESITQVGPAGWFPGTKQPRVATGWCGNEGGTTGALRLSSLPLEGRGLFCCPRYQ